MEDQGGWDQYASWCSSYLSFHKGLNLYVVLAIEAAKSLVKISLQLSSIQLHGAWNGCIYSGAGSIKSLRRNRLANPKSGRVSTEYRSRDISWQRNKSLIMLDFPASNLMLSETGQSTK
jgi:hypothetical protein